MPEQAERCARLWLGLSESLSWKAKQEIRTVFGSYEAAFTAFPDGFGHVVGAKSMEELASLKAIGSERLLKRLQELHINTALLDDGENYPALLGHIADPPDVLFYKGELGAQEMPAVAIVGSRRETRYGRQQAFRIARDLALSGVAVVSGLARGIDTAAHEGALAAGGRTIAVLGSGLCRLYPAENKELAERILAAGGALISELPPTAEPLAFRFPVRNRIVSGLSHALLLVEARENSGTLITVSHALAQGREVFALPGEVDAPGSGIPHRMIRDGARLCTCAEDLLEDMGWNATKSVSETAGQNCAGLAQEHRLVLQALQDDSLSFEELALKSGLDTDVLNTQLTLMDMDGLIETLPGGQFRRKRI